MMSNPVLRTENLSKRFMNITAVKNLNIEVNQGDIYGFLGPNGSGKTTTISMMLGLIRPTSGRIELFEQALSPDSLRRVGAVMDTGGFYADLSGLDNLLIFGGVHKRPDKVRVNEMLEMVGLAERALHKYHTYSMGMKQRLGVALAMLADPDFFIFDEPTNGMDPEGIAEIRGLIIQLSRRGKTVFLASHLLSEVEQVCSHLAILKNGAVVKQGALTSLLSAGGRSHLELTVSEPAHAIAALFDVGFIARIDGGKVLVIADAGQAEEISACLAARGIYLREMKQTKSTLESVFLEAIAEN